MWMKRQRGRNCESKMSAVTRRIKELEKQNNINEQEEGKIKNTAFSLKAVK